MFVFTENIKKRPVYRKIVKANNDRKGHMKHSTKECNRYAAIIFGIGITLLLVTTDEEKCFNSQYRNF